MREPANHGDPVLVKAADYSYKGWLVAILEKRSGGLRCVIEDENGRLFIHRPDQVTLREEEDA